MDDDLSNDTAALAREVWPQLTARLGALGAEISQAPFPVDDRSTAEGLRHLSRLMVYALQWCVEFGDPDFPAFHRYDDDIVKWGGPNVDNTYQRARVRGDGAYVISGTTGNNHGFVISTHEGDMQLGQYGVYDELWHDALTTTPDGTFELLLGGDPRATNWMPLDPRTTNLTIRQYYDDWDQHTPEHFDIRTVHRTGPPPALTAATLGARLDEAITWIESSVRYWNTYIGDALGRGGWNVITGAGGTRGGSNGIAYGSGFVDLGDDEALVVEGDVPDAWTWNFLLYNMGWFESLDIAHRVTSLNARQVHIDADGRFRIVIAHRDPGVQNWLDTSGLRRTMLSYRYIRTATGPVPTARLVRADDVMAHLPTSTPVFGPAERAAQIEGRRAHLARRFRR